MSDSDARAKLLKQIPGLYRFALLLSGEEQRAQQLVEELVRSTDVTTRTNGYERLLRLHLGLPSGSVLADPERTTGALHPLHRRIVQREIDRALPLAFMRLTPTDQLALLLTEVERLSNADAAEVLGVEPHTVLAWVQRAKRTLRAEVGASEKGERHAPLGVPLSEDWVGEALRRSFGRTGTSVPPSLMQRIRRRIGAGERSERRARRHETEESTSRTARQAVSAMLWVVLAGLLGLAVVRLLPAGRTGAEPTRLTEVLTESAGDAVSIELRTNEAGEAAAYLRARFQRRAAIPLIEGFALTGVGAERLRGRLSVPVLRYDAEGDPGTLFLLSYALIDSLAQTAYLPDSSLQRLAEETVRFPEDGETVTAWRRRDDLYFFVTDAPVDDLETRLRYAGPD